MWLSPLRHSPFAGVFVDQSGDFAAHKVAANAALRALGSEDEHFVYQPPAPPVQFPSLQDVMRQLLAPARVEGRGKGEPAGGPGKGEPAK